MAKIISVTNQKGGVGKTTTTVNLSAALVEKNQRVLLVDMDPQGNASVACGVNANEVENTVYDLLLLNCNVKGAIVKTRNNIDVIPANGDLAGAQVELLNEIGRELRLLKGLKAIYDDYDYILIDCPPSLNVLTINALVSSHSVLIPMQCEYFSLEGLSALVLTIRKIRGTLNSRLKIEGLLRTMFDGRNSLSNEVSKQLDTHFADKLYQTIIPRNVRLAEAPSYGESVISYDRNSKGSIAYLTLADELLRKNEAISDAVDSDNSI